jgi:FkbM family methyltransferase
VKCARVSAYTRTELYRADLYRHSGVQMNNLLGKIVRVAVRLRFLHRAMPLHDAIKLWCARKSSGETRIYLSSIERHIAVRNGTTDVSCLEKVFIYGEYESPFKLAPQLIVDAGANVGMATLYYSHQYPDAKIVAIEPELSNFKLLQRNCAGLSNVTLIQGALWPKNCGLEIEDLAVDAWMFRVSERLSGPDGQSVMAITIQDILQRSHADQIDLLKLDIEGAELQLFSDGAERWIDQIGSIAIEFHDRFEPGCARAFYSVLTGRKFHQEIRGENVFVKIWQ